MDLIFDTHAHYDDRKFNEDRDILLNSLPQQGVGRVVNVGASISSCKTTMDLAKSYDFIYAAIGVHPTDIGGLNEETFAWLKNTLMEEKAVAVGEIGLDYYWKDTDPRQQIQWFVRQLELAGELKKPVVIHSRDAAADTLDIMKGYGRDLGGIIHCFSYSVELAREYLNMGYYLGIGGVLTFSNGRKLREVVEYAPLEQLVLETDCPYLAPSPHRGERNSSLWLPLVVDKIAEIKGISREKVIQTTWDNGNRAYNLCK